MFYLFKINVICYEKKHKSKDKKHRKSRDGEKCNLAELHYEPKTY